MSAADIVFGNFAQAKLSTPPAGTGGLSFSVAAGKGALFPSPGGSQYFYGIFANAAKTVFEVVKVNARATDAFTIAGSGRGLDGSTAQTWTANDTFYYGMTAAMLAEFFGHVGVAVGAHAASAISYAGNAGLSSINVEDALDELDNEKAPLASPALTGNPTAPTQVSTDNDTSIATTAFVQALIAAQGFSTGDAKLTFKAVADAGWVMANDGTIGSGASGATTRANADTQALYVLLYTNISDTYAPVSGGRTGNAVNDFNSNKTLTLSKTLGRALAIAGSGATLTARVLGQNLGEENHTMTLAELVAHHHTYTITNYAGQSAGAGGFPINNTQVGANTGDTGTGTPFNVMQPTGFINMMIKL